MPLEAQLGSSGCLSILTWCASSNQSQIDCRLMHLMDCSRLCHEAIKKAISNKTPLLSLSGVICNFILNLSSWQNISYKRGTNALLRSIEGGVLIGIQWEIRSWVFIWFPFDLIYLKSWYLRVLTHNSFVYFTIPPANICEPVGRTKNN